MRNDKKLKNLVFILKNIEITSAKKEALSVRLAKDGIEMFLTECITEKDEKFIREKTTVYNPSCLQEPTLYVCDDSNIADEWKEQPILIYLHQGNADMDFSGYTYFIEGFEDVNAEYFNRIYQRLKGIPWTIAETERTRVREMTVEDLDAIYALYDSVEEVNFLPPMNPDKEEEREYLRRYIKNMYGIFEYGMWLIEEKECGEIIGRMGVENTDKEAELSFGFLISQRYRNKGYAAEAGRAVLNYLKEVYPDFNVLAFCHSDNEKALGLCAKLGVKVIKMI